MQQPQNPQMMPNFQFPQMQQMIPPQMPPVQMPPQKNCVLYVGDLEEQIDDQFIYQRFKRFGQITSSQVTRSQRRKDCANAVITFANEQSARDAKAEMNHTKLLTREIRVLWYKPGVRPSIDANIFIRKYPQGMTAKELDKKLTEKFGPVESLKLTENGYGYAQFEKKEQAEECLQKINEVSDQIECQKFSSKGERIDIRRNLYMKNLPQGTEAEIEEKLRTHLKEFGEITSMIVKSAKIQEQDKLFAFICFDKFETAKKVMAEWNNKDIFENGENVYVSWAEPKIVRIQKLRDMYTKQGNDTIIFTKNIKVSVSQQELIKAFEQYGKILRCQLKEPPQSEGKNFKPTKFGYVYFENKEDARKAQFNIPNDQQAKALYEDGEVYVNFLLNKDQYTRYKKRQSDQHYKNENEQNNNNQNNANQQQFMQMFSMLMQSLMAAFKQPQMPMMGGFQQQRNNNRQLGGRNETTRTNRQYNNFNNNRKQYQDHQQMMPQQNMPMQQNHMMQNQMPMDPQMLQQQRNPMPPMMPPMGMMPQQMPMGMGPMGPMGMMPQQMNMQQQMGMPQMQAQIAPQMPPQMPPQMQPQMPMQMQQQMKPQQPAQQPQPQQMPQLQPQQQPFPQQSVQFKSVQELKTNLNHFLSLDQQNQRKILGEMLFPKVKALVMDEIAAPKITGMLIDFEVFEVQDILELLENETTLQEQIKEAMELIQTQSQ